MTKSVMVIPFLSAISLGVLCLLPQNAFAQAAPGRTPAAAAEVSADIDPRERGPDDGLSRLALLGSDPVSTAASAYPTPPPPTGRPLLRQVRVSRIVVVSGTGHCPLNLPESVPAKLDCVKLE